jgi:hypothetical protein
VSEYKSCDPLSKPLVVYSCTHYNTSDSLYSTAYLHVPDALLNQSHIAIILAGYEPGLALHCFGRNPGIATISACRLCTTTNH